MVIYLRMVIYLQQDADDLHMVWLMSLPCLYLFPHKNPEWFTFASLVLMQVVLQKM